MIRIRVTRASGLIRLEIEGHAEFSPRGDDYDPVCAAVSAIADTALLGLEAIACSFPSWVTYDRVRRPLSELTNREFPSAPLTDSDTRAPPNQRGAVFPRS
jgi:uncharacterized protein